jgi:hypothetical protein
MVTCRPSWLGEVSFTADARNPNALKVSDAAKWRRGCGRRRSGAAAVTRGGIRSTVLVKHLTVECHRIAVRSRQIRSAREAPSKRPVAEVASVSRRHVLNAKNIQGEPRPRNTKILGGHQGALKAADSSMLGYGRRWHACMRISVVSGSNAASGMGATTEWVDRLGSG